MVSKRQMLDVCNSLFLTNKKKYLNLTSGKIAQLQATQLSNDVIFQLCLEDTNAYETVLRGVHEWWSESSFNPESKQFKS